MSAPRRPNAPTLPRERSKTDGWELRLYVAGKTAKSLAAIANLERLCREHLAGRHRIEVIDLLLDKGADVNSRDGIWYQTPLSMSLGGFGGFGNADALKRFLKAGAKDVDAATMTAAVRGNSDTGRL